MFIMRKGIFVYLFFLFVFLVAGASLLGFMLARTKNIKDTEEFTRFTLDLPSKVLDIRGDIITEYSSTEKRELITFDKISPSLIHALLAREDRTFYRHPGFSLKAIIRAVIGQILDKNLGGGSTITQQTAGILYCDRTDKSIKRKIIELWWALQMERRYSKDEIMELYLNKVYLGSGTIHGISAAAKFYCNHSAAELTPAESAIIVVQLSSPTLNNPFEYPNTARNKQTYVLNEMIELGYLDQKTANESFEEYWDSFDYTRTATSGFYSREDRAPWFSEYVRRELETLLYGTMNYYTDGYVINTTCDLRHQAIAEKYLLPQIEKANRDVERDSTSDKSSVAAFRNMTTLVSLCFDLPGIKADTRRNKVTSLKMYREDLNPTVDVLSLLFDIQDLQIATKRGAAKAKEAFEKRNVQGAMVCIENETGYITAIIGGSKYNQANQHIRATQGRMQVGSSIKPLYYSAAIDARKITAASCLADTPRVFENRAGVQYIPSNYSGKWEGTVLAYYALANSLNIPAIDVLDKVGFNGAIDRMANLTGVTDPQRIRENFPRVYPLALGVSSFSPLEMAKAFAIFANEGRDVDPIAILNIENRDGKTILDPERDMLIAQKKRGAAMQVVSPQTAYIMTDMLKYTVRGGTLFRTTQRGNKFTYKDSKTGKYYKIPMAGKTGTTQNWSDAWTVGYSPYYTTAVWFGFDRGGRSLGMQNYGSALAGPVWADFMYEIHKGKSQKSFVRPETGLGYAQVCKRSGLRPTKLCNEGVIGLYFLAGTTPRKSCAYHEINKNMKTLGIDRLKNSVIGNENASSAYDDDDTNPLTISDAYGDSTDEEDTDELDIDKWLEESGLLEDEDTTVEVEENTKDKDKDKKKKDKDKKDEDEEGEPTNPLL
ncbi:MAG: penicillin-binding protein [Treponema sp.]|nr:MAG: penicillin-binding protein [Treponema sp.]